MRGHVYNNLSDRTSLLLTTARAKIYDSRGIDPEIFYSDTALFIDSTFGPLDGTDACPDNNPNNRVICSSAPYRVSNENNILSATLTSEIGANTLTSISAWSNYNERPNEDDIDQLRIPLVAQNDSQRRKPFTQAVRMVSPHNVRVDWRVGR